MARSTFGPTSSRKARHSQRQDALAAASDYLSAMLAGRRADLGSGKIRTPPRLERQAGRHGGGYRSRGQADYDWFYGLSKAEQSRIRSNWMTDNPNAPTPDEVESAGLPIREWLALNRGHDAARAVASGRHVQANRYGGRDPVRFLDIGKPRDNAGTPRKGRGDYHDTGRVQFFTDHNGEVHPIRASYQTSSSSGRSHGVNAYGQPVTHTPTVIRRDEEAF